MATEATAVNLPPHAYVSCWCGHASEDHDQTPPYDCRACREKFGHVTTGGPLPPPSLVALVTEWQAITKEMHESGDDWTTAQANRWRRAVNALLAYAPPAREEAQS